MEASWAFQGRKTVGASARGWNVVLRGAGRPTARESWSLQRKKWEGRLSRWADLGLVRTTLPGGCDCILDTGDSRKVFEKGNGMMKRSSENVNLLTVCSVLELREVRGGKTSLVSRPWQLE